VTELNFCVSIHHHHPTTPTTYVQLLHFWHRTLHIEESTATTNSGSYNVQSDNNSGFNDMGIIYRDPNLPNFRPPEHDTDEEDKEIDLNESIVSKFASVLRKTLDDAVTKQLIRDRGRERASEKRKFLAEKRASMINEEETDEIIKSAFEYLLSLHEFIETILNFQTNYSLYNAFKEELESFSRVVSDSDWTEMLPQDDSLDDMIDNLDDKINGLKGSLESVNKMHMKF
jgi:hypothetical protein